MASLLLGFEGVTMFLGARERREHLANIRALKKNIKRGRNVILRRSDTYQP